MNNNGHNPMLWDCNKGGLGANCFNKKCRPKIEVFSDCFAGKINFGDVDGIVEINGKGLLLEWKSYTDHIKQSQEIMYSKLTKTGILTVICVFGNAETMQVKQFYQYKYGIKSEPMIGNLDDLKLLIRQWRARTNF